MWQCFSCQGGINYAINFKGMSYVYSFWMPSPEEFSLWIPTTADSFSVCVCVCAWAPKKNRCKTQDMDVSENRSTPKSSILIGFSIINHPFYPYLPIIQKSPGQSKSGRAKHQLLDEIQVFVRSLRLRKSTKDRCDKLLPRYETPRISMDVFFKCISIQSDSIAVILGLCKKPKLWWLHPRELTYPTLGRGKSSSKMAYQGDMLIPWRVTILLT